MTTTKAGYDKMKKDLATRLSSEKSCFDQRVRDYSQSQKETNKTRQLQEYHSTLSENFTRISDELGKILSYLDSNQLNEAVKVAINLDVSFSLQPTNIEGFMAKDPNNFSQDELYEIGRIINCHRYNAEVAALRSIVVGWVSALMVYSCIFER